MGRWADGQTGTKREQDAGLRGDHGWSNVGRLGTYCVLDIRTDHRQGCGTPTRRIERNMPRIVAKNPASARVVGWCQPCARRWARPSRP